MARFGYIFISSDSEAIDSSKKWMQDAALRRSTARLQNIQRGLKIGGNVKIGSREEREKTIVSMYNSCHSIDDIWKICGFKSRSSIFRVLNKYEVKLNRSKFSGPLGSLKNKSASK